MNKMQQEQPISSSSSNIPTEIVFKKLVEDMEKGKGSSEIIRSLVFQQSNDEHDLYHEALNHHSMVALEAYANSLSMLKSFNLDEEGVIMKRELDCENDSFDGQCDFEGSHGVRSIKDRRGCYQRRQSVKPRVEEVTHVTDDGFGWRKYGQKTISEAKHPRNYYRCTHKVEQKCEATKQVQQISENPSKYKIIYHGNHTCNNNLYKPSPIIINDNNPNEHSSAYFLSFDQSNQINTNFNHTSSFFFGAAVMQQNTISEKLSSSVSYDSNNNTVNYMNQCSNYSDNMNTSKEISETTENYNSTANSYSLEEDYPYIYDMEVRQDWWAAC